MSASSAFNRRNPLDSPSYAQLSLQCAKSAERINPFINRSKHDWYYWFKVVVMTPVVVPVRTFFLIFWLAGVWLLSAIAVVGRPIGGDAPPPFETWRKWVLRPTRWLLRGLLFTSGFYRIKEVGEPDPRAAVIVPNHPSLWESIYFGTKLLASPVSKDSLLAVPAIGALIRALQPIVIARESSQSRLLARDSIVKRARAFKQGKYPPLLIFPEGTCVSGALVQFKTGAFEAGEPVQPVIVRFPFKHFDPSWVDYVSMLGLLYNTFCQFVNYMEVEWLPLYVPNEAEKRDPVLYAQNVRTEMSRIGGLPMTNHSIDDNFLQLAAFAERLPADAVGFEVKTLRELLSKVDLAQMKAMLKEFAAVSHHSPTITVEQFARALNMPLTPSVRQLFRAIDTDGSGTINFREWLVSHAILNQRKDETEPLLRFAFSVIDLDGDGHVDKSEFLAVMGRINPIYWSKENTEALFAEVDAQNTGRINVEQFLEFMGKHPLIANLVQRWTQARDSGDAALFNFTPPPPPTHSD